MAHLEPDLQHAAEVFARVSTLARALGVSAEPLLDACAVLDVEPARFCRIEIGAQLDAISVWCRWPRDENAGAALLEDLSLRDRLQGSRAQRLLERDCHERYVEYALLPDGKVATALHLLGLASQDADLQLLASTAHVGDAIERFGSLASRLGERSAGVSDRYQPTGHHSWRMYVPLPMRTRADHESTPERIDSTCEALGVTMPQRLLIRDLHSVLAKNRTSLASLRAGPGVVYPELSIAYPGVRLESVVRVLQGISTGGKTPEELGAGIGALAGATGSELAHYFELTLRNEEPPTARIAVDLEMGQPCRI